MKHAVSTISALTLLLLATARVPAQPATASAEQLFRDGKRLMAAGNIAAACDAFEGSYRAEAAISTLLNLADCREKNQQYASAWGHFLAAARQARTDPSLAPMLETAQRRAAALEPRLSYLIINVPDEARVDGLVITRDGAAVDPATWNRDLPVDGGTYVIAGKAPAFEPWSTTVKVRPAEDKQSVNVPRFATAVVTTPQPTEVVAVDEERGHPTAGLTGKRKLAIGAFALGAVGLGTGLAFELKSGSTYDEAKASRDNAERHDLTDQSNRERRYAVVAAGVGVAAVAAGVYLWLDGRRSTAGDHVTLTPVVDRDGIAATLLGRF